MLRRDRSTLKTTRWKVALCWRSSPLTTRWWRSRWPNVPPRPPMKRSELASSIAPENLSCVLHSELLGDRTCHRTPRPGALPDSQAPSDKVSGTQESAHNVRKGNPYRLSLRQRLAHLPEEWTPVS